MLQGRGANTDPSAPPAQQSWALWDAEGHPPLTKDAYHPWDRTPPPLAGLPPFRVCKAEAGALFFLETQRMRGLWEPVLPVDGCLHRLFALGMDSFIMCPGTELARPGRMVCCNFGCFWLRRGRSRGHRTWRKGQQLVQPWRWGFQSAQRSANIKLLQC